MKQKHVSVLARLCGISLPLQIIFRQTFTRHCKFNSCNPNKKNKTFGWKPFVCWCGKSLLDARPQRSRCACLSWNAAACSEIKVRRVNAPSGRPCTAVKSLMAGDSLLLDTSRTASQWKERTWSTTLSVCSWPWRWWGSCRPHGNSEPLKSRIPAQNCRCFTHADFNETGCLFFCFLQNLFSAVSHPSFRQHPI